MRILPVLALAATLATSSALADDGAASIAAGGIVMTREPRITMAKEVLSISESKVVVNYDFRNDTGADITTEVAFPIPDYKPEEVSPSFQGFDDFKLWVDEKPVHYKIETKALVGGRDYSSLLRSMGIDIQSFGHSNDESTRPQLDKLNAIQKERLRKTGLIDTYGGPAWKVRKKYYWSQVFPAHGVVHIRHQYSPVLGNSNSIGDPNTYSPKDENDAELASTCPTAELLHALQEDSRHPNHMVSINYVDFILTTANTWKQPIEDFTLTIERSQPAHNPLYPATGVNFISLCWSGPVEKVGADHFRGHATDFVPSKELRVGFLHGYGWSPMPTPKSSPSPVQTRR
jgi:Domain of unknown function (DUF4424)